MEREFTDALRSGVHPSYDLELARANAEKECQAGRFIEAYRIYRRSGLLRRRDHKATLLAERLFEDQRAALARLPGNFWATQDVDIGYEAWNPRAVYWNSKWDLLKVLFRRERPIFGVETSFFSGDEILKDIASVPHLTHVSVVDENFNIGRLKALGDLAGVVSFEFRIKHVSTELMNWLAGRSDIRALGFDAVTIDVDAFQSFNHCPELRHFSLVSSKVNPASLSFLKDCQKLESLELRGGKFGDDGMKHLQKLERLKILRLNETEVTDAGLTCLDSLENLETLDLQSNQLGDKALDKLATATHLFHLNLSKTNVTGATLNKLAGIHNLRALRLDCCPINDASLGALAQFKELRTLSLSATNTQGFFLPALKEMINLQALQLSDCEISDDGLSTIPALPRLASLSLNGCRVTGVGLKALSILPGLAELDLGHNFIRDDDLKDLADFKHLRSLDLFQTEITGAAIPFLKPLSSLRSLNIDCPGMSSQDAKILEQCLPDCRVLHRSWS